MSVVTTTINDGIASVAMNRADKRNALNPELVAAMHSTISSLVTDAAVRVIVIKGNGAAFCAGADLEYLRTLSEYGTMENLDDSTRLMELMRAIAMCPKPVIAMVHGPAIAGGCGLASVCDIVIAGRSEARFGYSEVAIGFIPAIVMVFLLRKIGDAQARRLVLTAQTISADEALRIGLVSMVVADEDLENETQTLARRLCKNSGSAMALSKAMLWNLHGMSIESGLTYATTMNVLARQTDDCKSGIQRFLSDRK